MVCRYCGKAFEDDSDDPTSVFYDEIVRYKSGNRAHLTCHNKELRRIQQVKRDFASIEYMGYRDLA